MASKCKYCGSASYGSGCMKSPTKKHDTLMMKNIVFSVVLLLMALVVCTVLQRNIIMVPEVISAAGVEVHR